MTQTVSKVMFPPYGHMVQEYEADIADGGTAPSDWRETAGDWLVWRSKVLDLLSTVLWPRYDYKTQAWVGPAANFMEELTSADFALLRGLRSRLDTPAGLANPLTRFELFQFEDTTTVQLAVNGIPGITLKAIELRSVERTLVEHMTGVVSQPILDGLVSRYRQGLGDKAGSLDLQLKQQLQRPRAYQMAVLMNQDWFDHRWARTAVSPAMISGHCFQGSMGGVAAFYELSKRTNDAKAMDRLEQHTVGIGDQRVLAGVHYPSDNLSSWIVALLLCPLVCEDVKGRKMLWRAIERHSVVFASIRDAVDDGKAEVYRRSLDLVRLLGEQPCMGVDAALAHVVS
jgi:hypothetical protein